MRHAQTLQTVLLASTLLFPAGVLAGPKAKPFKTPELSPYLTAAEHMCRARATFAYNRALDRNNGSTFTDALLRVREWDAVHGVPQDIRDAHEHIIQVLYTTIPWLTPDVSRQAVEIVCLKESQAAPAPRDARY
jgi:hypothetical protein